MPKQSANQKPVKGEPSTDSDEKKKKEKKEKKEKRRDEMASNSRRGHSQRQSVGCEPQSPHARSNDERRRRESGREDSRGRDRRASSQDCAPTSDCSPWVSACCEGPRVARQGFVPELRPQPSKF